MQFTNDELMFILDALKRRRLELWENCQDNSESYKMAIELQGRINNYFLEEALVHL